MRNDEFSLIESAKKGDRQAFSSLVEEYKKKIYCLAYRLVCNHHDADEVAQNTFIRLYRSLDKVQEGKPLYPWLYRVATNYALKLLKQRQKNLGRFSSLDVPGQVQKLSVNTPSPQACTERREMAEILTQAVNSLPLKQKTVFLLFEVEGLSLLETAAACGIPEGTVKWRLYTAKMKLRDKLKRFKKREER